MKAREMFRADLERYFAHYDQPLSTYRKFLIVTQTEGIWAIWWYRFGQYARNEAPKPIRFLLKAPCLFAQKVIGHLIGVHIYPGATIGPGFYIGHYGGIWIASQATIGANCNVAQGVTIGTATKNRSLGPRLGDRVWVGPNAIVTGAVRIGNGAVIGANSLIASNLPENAVALGVPAKVIGYSGSGSLIQLPTQPSNDTR